MKHRSEQPDPEVLARLLREEAARSRPAFCDALHERTMEAVRDEASALRAESAYGSAKRPDDNAVVAQLSPWRLRLRRWAMPVAAAACLALAVGLISMVNSPFAGEGGALSSDIAGTDSGNGIAGDSPLPDVADESEGSSSEVARAWTLMTASDPQLAGLDQDARRLTRYLIGHVPVEMLTSESADR
ncbi:MAG: hypothetical protein MI741_17560 [Rhodospirillales bacterium]|nr:hypothetical protein [Rhodospirillales bacterium]